MHVLIVSIGCVIVPARRAPVSAPAARAVFFSTPPCSTSLSWMSGVMPSMDMVNMDSRPIVIVAPRASDAAPCSATNRRGVSNMRARTRGVSNGARYKS